MSLFNISNDPAEDVNTQETKPKKSIFPRPDTTLKAVLIAGILTLCIIIPCAYYMFENVPAGYICVIQSPISGKLAIHVNPGVKLQLFGRVTLYPRAGVYEFLQSVAPGESGTHSRYNAGTDKSLKITFNDGGEAWISGSIRYEYPLEIEKIEILHKMFSHHDAVVDGLIKKTIERSVYMSGPLMSSIDSFMSRRADLPKLIEDQARNGLYEVITRDVVMEDEFTKERKTIKQAEPVKDSSAPGGLKRQEESVLTRYGISFSNFATNNISYSETVQQRVDALFAAQSDIQLATLNAKKAEQDRKTAEEKGKAEATAAEWRAKTIAADEIAAAEKTAQIQNIEAERDKNIAIIAIEKQREVAEKEKVIAELYRDAQILRAEADATYRRETMAADGALELKLNAYKEVNRMYADALMKYTGSWVPQIILGETSGGEGGNTGITLIDLLTTKTARDLALDLGVENK